MEQRIVSPTKTKLVNEEGKILRECRGRRCALLNRVFALSQETDNRTHFYVSSEVSADRYYFVEYKQNANFCTCWDFASHRTEKCKHLYAVQYALHLGLVQPIGRKLPLTHKKVVTTNVSGKSWEDDEYTF